MRLRNPVVRVAPDAGAVFADYEVGGLALERSFLRVTLDQWKVDAELVLQSAGRFELGRSNVDRARLGAPSGKPGRNIGRAAAELDGIHARDVRRKHSDFRLR